MISRAKSLVVNLLLITVGLTCMSANRHLQTTADQLTRSLNIRLDGETLECNLEAPGTRIAKYPNGHIRELEFDVVTTRVLVTFFPEKRHGREMVNSIQRYTIYDEKMLPNGEWQSFTPTGTLLTRQNWHAGKLHGKQEVYNRFGQMTQESHFEEGYPVGVWKMYYVEGGIATAVTFPASSALWKETHPTSGYDVGSEESKSSVAHMPFRKHLTAEEVWYSQSGAKLYMQKYGLTAERDGSFTMLPSGEAKAFHRNGAVKSETDIRNGTGTVVKHLRDENSTYRQTTHWTGGHVIGNHLSRP